MAIHKPAPLVGLGEFIDRQLVVWDTPGAAIVVVKNGEVIHAEGYGVRDVDKALPVTRSTVFPIASVTKSFTASVLAILNATGAFDWDKPVREYFPEFRLTDPSTSDRVTTRDMLSHASGLPPHSWVWINSQQSRREICLSLRHLSMNAGLGQTYQYNNHGYAVAGHVAEVVTGSTWESLVDTLLFQPLGMSNASVTIEDLRRTGDFALPYERNQRKRVQQGEYMKLSPINPAGGINASVDDMARYLSMHLNRGVSGDLTIIPASEARIMQSPHVAMPGSNEYLELGHPHYGLGFIVTTYRGMKHVWHNGGLRGGFRSMLAMMPDHGIGVYVVANMSPTPIPYIVAYYVLDRLLGLTPLPWSDRFMEKRLASDAETDIHEAAFSHVGVPLSRDPADYAGIYHHPAYGDLHIEAHADRRHPLSITFRGYSSPIVHRGDGSFEAPPDTLNRLARVHLRFEPEWNGNIRRIAIPFEPAVAEIEFVRASGEANHVR